MSTLAQLITLHLNKTDAEIVTALNTLTMSRVDSTKYTWAGLAMQFGTTTVAGMRSQLIAVPHVGPLVCEILTSTGIDFSLPESQSMLTSLIPVLGETAVNNLKAIGVTSISEYQDAGFAGTVTLAEVTAARAVLEAESQRLATEQRAATAWNVIVNTAVSEGKTWGQIVALLVADQEVNP